MTVFSSLLMLWTLVRGKFLLCRRRHQAHQDSLGYVQTDFTMFKHLYHIIEDQKTV